MRIIIRRTSPLPASKSGPRRSLGSAILLARSHVALLGLEAHYWDAAERSHASQAASKQRATPAPVKPVPTSRSRGC